MKIDRLLGIIHLLLQKEKITADGLSQTFEVSKRTILRDVNSLCAAGVPIVTTQGYKGGISLMDGYKLENSFINEKELSHILLGLKALKSIDKGDSFEGLSQRFPGHQPAFKHMHIDLSGYYKTDLVQKFEKIEEAIEEKYCLTFVYHNHQGSSWRLIRPYAILFQWSSWYLWGFCEKRQEERLFKINRMTDFKLTTKPFTGPIPPYATPIEGYYTNQTYPVVLWFSAKVKWRVIDEYGFNYIANEDEEGFEFHFSFDNKAYLLQWLLSFGSLVKVLSPKEIQKDLHREYQKSLAYYEAPQGR